MAIMAAVIITVFGDRTHIITPIRAMAMEIIMVEAEHVIIIHRGRGLTVKPVWEELLTG